MGNVLNSSELYLKKVYCETNQGLIHGRKSEKLKSAESWHLVRVLLQQELNESHKKGQFFFWFFDAVLYVVPKVGNIQAQST